MSPRTVELYGGRLQREEMVWFSQARALSLHEPTVDEPSEGGPTHCLGYRDREPTSPSQASIYHLLHHF